MPGLLGIASTQGPDEAARRFGRARDRMRRHVRQTAETISAQDGSCLLGRFSLAPAATLDQDAPSARIQTPAVIFHGVLHNEGALAREVGETDSGGRRERVLAAMYDRHGTDFIDRLEGEFCLAVIDPRQRLVLVATDTAGTYPIYWRVDQAGLIFSSDLSALLRATTSVDRLNLRAVADYLTLGAVLGDRTLADGVCLLDPGTVLTYHVDSARGSLAAFVRLDTFFRPKVSEKAAYFEAVSAAFRVVVDSATADPRPVGISLSGGLDSRAILSAMRNGSEQFRSYTLGVEGCADQVIADRLAKIAGTRHQFFQLNDSYLRDFLPNMERMVSLTDGLYLSHGLTEMLALQFIGQMGIDVLLRGHGGELAKAHLAWPLHTDERVYGLASIDDLVNYLSTRANYITRDLPLSRVLTPSAAAIAGPGSRAAFADILRGTELTPAEACSFLYLHELNRRFTVPSLELFRSRVEVRLPYLDRRFLRVLLAAPSEWRDSTEIHRRLTGTAMPKLLSVRNSNTGAPANAGPAVEFALDKLNTLLRRFNVSGYRHYHNFDDWMRRMLLETVEAELLGSGSRVQAFVSRERIASLIGDTRTGAADRSYLLQVLLILELWQRENRIEAAA